MKADTQSATIYFLCFISSIILEMPKPSFPQPPGIRKSTNMRRLGTEVRFGREESFMGELKKGV